MNIGEQKKIDILHTLLLRIGEMLAIRRYPRCWISFANFVLSAARLLAASRRWTACFTAFRVLWINQQWGEHSHIMITYLCWPPATTANSCETSRGDLHLWRLRNIPYLAVLKLLPVLKGVLVKLRFSSLIYICSWPPSLSRCTSTSNTLNWTWPFRDHGVEEEGAIEG